MRITYILWDNRPALDGIPDVAFETTEGLPSLEKIRDGLLIHPSEEHEADIISFLDLLRRDEKHFLAPVFFTPAPSDILQLLGNGTVQTAAEIKGRVNAFQNRQRQLYPADMTDQDARLLAYAHVFGAGFQPLSSDLAPLYYIFPLAEALAEAETDIPSWLGLLAGKGLLTRETIVDRVRTCPRCTSAHLHFLDICPSCNKIRIHKDVFLHCFTCGHVAPQTSFIARDLLQCPNCQTKLRHIGSDYDRALETYGCNDCESVFAEPYVVARCMKCGTQVEPEDLVPVEICPFSLSPKGEAVALVGWQETPFALLDDLSFITLDVFTYLVSWLTRLHIRYPDAVFSILGIRFLNLEALAQSMGSGRLSALVNAFSVRCRELLRTTDVVCRSGPDVIWVLLPRTPAQGCELLKTRFRQLIEDTRLEDGRSIEMTQANWTSDPSSGHEDPEFLLARLSTVLRGD